MSDAWNRHLERLGLLDLENLAQSVYYRIRVANAWQFDLEYTGGLLKYQQPDFRLKTFTDKQEARTYLLSVRQELQALYGLDDEMPNM